MTEHEPEPESDGEIIGAVVLAFLALVVAWKCLILIARVWVS